MLQCLLYVVLLMMMQGSVFAGDGVLVARSRSSSLSSSSSSCGLESLGGESATGESRTNPLLELNQDVINNGFQSLKAHQWYQGAVVSTAEAVKKARSDEDAQLALQSHDKQTYQAACEHYHYNQVKALLSQNDRYLDTLRQRQGAFDGRIGVAELSINSLLQANGGFEQRLSDLKQQADKVPVLEQQINQLESHQRLFGFNLNILGLVFKLDFNSDHTWSAIRRNAIAALLSFGGVVFFAYLADHLPLSTVSELAKDFCGATTLGFGSLALSGCAKNIDDVLPESGTVKKLGKGLFWTGAIAAPLAGVSYWAWNNPEQTMEIAECAQAGCQQFTVGLWNFVRMGTVEEVAKAAGEASDLAI